MDEILNKEPIKRVDQFIKKFNYIYGAAGHPDCVFKIRYNELIKLTNGTEIDITS